MSQALMTFELMQISLGVIQIDLWGQDNKTENLNRLL